MPHTQHAQHVKPSEAPVTHSENFFIAALAAMAPIPVGDIYMPLPKPNISPVATANMTTAHSASPTELSPKTTRTLSMLSDGGAVSKTNPVATFPTHHHFHLGQLGRLGDAFHHHHHGHLVEKD
ncbi:hypothetical protein SEUCBS139899_005614 [Sporothrix eucalyptigena]